MGIFALVKNGVVLNVVKADQDFVDSAISRGYCDQAVPADGVVANIGDVYSNSAFSSPETLAAAKAARLLDLKTSVQSWIDGRYDMPTRMNFLVIYTLAKDDLLVNRAAYIKPLLTWANSIISFSGTHAAAISALESVAAVKAYQWDFSALEASDPKLTLLAAIQIAN